MTQRACLLVAGYEWGLLNATGKGLFSFVQQPSSGAVTVQSSTVRTGSYALRCNATPGFAFVTHLLAAFTTTPAFGRLYLRFATLPDGDCYLAYVQSSAVPSVSVGIAFHSATSKIRPFAYDDSQSPLETFGPDGPTVATGVWYRLDFRVQQPSGADGKMEWYWDGVQQTTFTATGYGGNSYDQIVLGVDNLVTGTVTADVFFDDVCVISDDANSFPTYPLGDGKVVLLSPSAEGTHSTSASFTDDAANSPPVNPHLRVDEIPVSASDTDYFKQTTVGAGDYIELALGNLVDSPASINGVWFRAGRKAESSGTANETVRLWDTNQGAGSDLVLSASASTRGWGGRNLANSTTNWSAADIDALLFRIGFSTDVAPLIRVHDVHVEVDYPESAIELYGIGMITV